ncbi:uncharacterized protein F4812DRAFT_140312 [Daldinia caldariorum]|uniref:uncharacterized protein n=1 Tax=Daldinia caldariorum TaxID=326644 RepID=UPI002007B792|nr:uncharacterized protein F4812DRAFT_140312 [Daldinia caldariorum]KAI1464821.1 hypothetical protein F4812DRAFT_140312 [Daldinia caldariorum]
MPRRNPLREQDVTQDLVKKPSPEFSKYQDLIPELRLEIWRQVLLPPGVHFLTLEFRRKIKDGNIVNELLVDTWGCPSSDRSTWRVRNKISKTDKYSWDVMKKFSEGTSILRPRGFSRKFDAFIDCTRDLVCVRFLGRILNPGIHPFRNLEVLGGIRYVGIDYKNQAVSGSVNMGFQCLCRDNIHKASTICPKTLEDFVPHFQGMETLYFMVQLTVKNIKSLPPVSRGKKRDHQGTIKEQGGQPAKTMPVPSRTPARNSQIVSETFHKFLDIARRDKLDSFEDKRFTYYEVQEKDTSCLLIHEELWNVFSDLKDLWAVAKSKVPPPYQVREPKLKVLVYAESKKNPAQS